MGRMTVYSQTRAIRQRRTALWGSLPGYERMVNSRVKSTKQVSEIRRPYMMVKIKFG